MLKYIKINHFSLKSWNINLSEMVENLSHSFLFAALMVLKNKQKNKKTQWRKTNGNKGGDEEKIVKAMKINYGDNWACIHNKDNVESLKRISPWHHRSRHMSSSSTFSLFSETWKPAWLFIKNFIRSLSSLKEVRLSVKHRKLLPRESVWSQESS